MGTESTTLSKKMVLKSTRNNHNILLNERKKRKKKDARVEGGENEAAQRERSNDIDLDLETAQSVRAEDRAARASEVTLSGPNRVDGGGGYGRYGWPCRRFVTAGR